MGNPFGHLSNLLAPHGPITPAVLIAFGVFVVLAAFSVRFLLRRQHLWGWIFLLLAAIPAYVMAGVWPYRMEYYFIQRLLVAVCSSFFVVGVFVLLDPLFAWAGKLLRKS